MIINAKNWSGNINMGVLDIDGRIMRGWALSPGNVFGLFKSGSSFFFLEMSNNFFNS